MVASNKLRRGFTIVELLIVIVVIGVLAAISIVAYSGIQNRAYNTSMISGARQTVGLINAYVAANGTYPTTASRMCATSDNKCNDYTGSVVSSSNDPLLDSLKTIGSPAAAAPSGNAGGRFGIVYYYYPSTVYSGLAQPAYVYYVLKGTATNCVLPNVTTDASPVYSATTPSTTGYSWTNATSQMTGCYVHIDGPTI